MLIALGATTENARTGRALEVLATSAWAYLAFLGAGDTARAAQLLRLFQYNYKQNYLMLPAGSPSLSVITGTYDSATRAAISFILGAYNLGTATSRVLPSRESELGRWFLTYFGTQKPRSENADLWWFVSKAEQVVPASEVFETLSADAFAFIEGIEAPPPPSGSTATVPRAVPPAPGQALPAPLPTAASRLLQTAPKKDLTKPIVAGVGLVAIGAVIFLMMNRRRR